MIYNPETAELLTNGKRVHTFIDNKSINSKTFEGSLAQDSEGEIEVVAIRDSNGKLTGLKIYEKNNLPKKILKLLSSKSNKGGDTASNY